MTIETREPPQEPARYLRNTWYLAAWADELERSPLVARTICDQRLVLFKAKGAVTALKDVCPHRFAP